MVDPDNTKYYKKEECIQKIQEIKYNDDNLDLDNEYEPEILLNTRDPKIPPTTLFRFYGGINNNEYF